jgi:hypothetical protein
LLRRFVRLQISPLVSAALVALAERAPVPNNQPIAKGYSVTLQPGAFVPLSSLFSWWTKTYQKMNLLIDSGYYFRCDTPKDQSEGPARTRGRANGRALRRSSKGIPASAIVERHGA